MQYEDSINIFSRKHVLFDGNQHISSSPIYQFIIQQKFDNVDAQERRGKVVYQDIK